MLATAEQEVAALQQRFRADVQSHLRQAIAGSESGLFALLMYHFGWEDVQGRPTNAEGGKALRPVLCLTACDLAGGDWREALPAAAALELVHNFSLIHDDIQDRDATRWGRPTLWTVHGERAALSAGNAMRAVADQTIATMAETGLPSALVVEAATELTERYLEMIEGQYLDLSFERAESVTVDQYLDMISRKTGALIESAMYLGALVATRDPQAAHAFGACGRRLGLAFQIRDDFLGIWGDPKATGKAVGADIRRKKKSMPIVHLFQSTTSSERAWLEEAYAAEEIVGEDAEHVLTMLESIDAPGCVQSTAEAHARGAIEKVGGLGLSDDALHKLEAMAEFFVTRQK